MPSVAVNIYSSISFFLIIFSIIAKKANNNYLKLKIAKKIFGFKNNDSKKDKFKHFLSLYNLKNKVNDL